MKKTVRFIVALLAALLVLLCAACKQPAIDDNQAEPETPVPTQCPTATPTMRPTATPEPTAPPQTPTPAPTEDVSNNDELYRPIIEAYAALEQSGFTSFDKDLIGDCLLAVNEGSTYNFGWDNKPAMMYALYDINNDGTPELVIGADEGISGIYTLQNGKPVSVIQVQDRHNLFLLTDSNGNCVIEDSWGHMGYATEYFFAIDENGDLATLDVLYTNGDDRNGDEFFGHFRAKDVDGEEVSITEEEYCELLRKYGSLGYEPLEDIGEQRTIDIKWRSVI